jgi:hypothetical protein
MSSRRKLPVAEEKNCPAIVSCMSLKAAPQAQALESDTVVDFAKAEVEVAAVKKY